MPVDSESQLLRRSPETCYHERKANEANGSWTEMTCLEVKRLADKRLATNGYGMGLKSSSKQRCFTAIDLFSGAGGVTLGLLDAGFEVRLCSDFSASCFATHSKNFPETEFLLRDLIHLSSREILQKSRLNVGELDLLIGGPPCQGFSIIGQRRLMDPRNSLLARFIKIAGELRPKAFVIENVCGLATLEKGAVLREIGIACREQGYNVNCAELLAAQYGVPQMRWRMFFIAWREDINKSGGFPEPTHGSRAIGDLVPNRTISKADLEGFVNIEDAIGDLPQISAGGSCHIYTCEPKSAFQKAMRANSGEALANHYAANLSRQNLTRIKMLKPGEDWRSLPLELLPPGMQRALRKDHTRRYRRMRWDGVARSIITRFRDPKSGEYTHPEQDRTLSIREAARIQSFPDWFTFVGSMTDQYDQVGNAVPPMLASAVCKEIKTILSKRAHRAETTRSRYSIPRLDVIAAE